MTSADENIMGARKGEPQRRERTRVIVAESDPLFRDVLHRIIRSSEHMELVASVNNASDAVRTAEQTSPDVVLVSAELGGRPEGIRAAHMIKAASPSTGIVLISAREDEEFMASVPERKAAGWSFLLKQSVGDTASLVSAIEGAAWGLVTVDPAMTERLRPRGVSVLERLTHTELSVLKQMASGHTDAAIARRLELPPEEVPLLIASVYEALHVEADHALDQRVKAVLTYMRESAGHR